MFQAPFIIPFPTEHLILPSGFFTCPPPTKYVHMLSILSVPNFPSILSRHKDTANCYLKSKNSDSPNKKETASVV